MASAHDQALARARAALRLREAGPLPGEIDSGAASPTFGHEPVRFLDEADVAAAKQHVALRIRELRQQTGLTLRETARRAGCSVSSLTSMEAGLVPNQSKVAPRIIAVLVAEVEAQQAV